MKKKLLAGLLVIPLAFGLSACGSDNSTSSEPYVAPQDADVNPSDEDGFVSEIRRTGNTVLNLGSQAQLLEMGYNACNALDNGESVGSLAIKLVQTQTTSEGERAVAIIIAASVIYLCPEYKYQAENL